MSETVNRAAIIIYTPNPDDASDYMILLGVSRYGINSIGGGKEIGEQEIRCCARECAEETRNLIDFRECRGILKQAVTFKHYKCIYYLVSAEYETIRKTCDDFRHVSLSSDPNDKTNELTELKMVSSKKLITQFVNGRFNDDTSNVHYRPEFVNMFMDVGFDRLHGNTFNYYINTIAMHDTLNVPIADLPEIVSVTPICKGLPRIYGSLKHIDDSHKRTYWIGPQYYFTNDEGVALFR